jgi:hypothetical protein
MIMPIAIPIAAPIPATAILDFNMEHPPAAARPPAGRAPIEYRPTGEEYN